MKLLDDLRAEHALIEQVVLSLRAFGKLPERDAADSAAYLRFFRLWAGRWHHAREEDVLFPALVATEVPGDRGPLAILVGAHHAMAHLLDEMESGLTAELADKYCRALLHHIDAENSVLFPESETRLRRAGGAELASRAPDADELAARGEGERLIARYPPDDGADIFRGDGCTACPAYGDGCDGIEREWWSALEWEDIRERMGNG
ncbi:MAG TPA: hemerythrin domain-containing protein [Myxococcales bacterium]|nr:hemerythrin domain-containing protein [Myxococcales bacterium]